MATGEFIVTCEVVARPGKVDQTLDKCVALYGTGLVHAISVADNPDGEPALLADAFAAELAQHGVGTLVQFCSRDRNRRQALSQLYALARAGLTDIVAMTGDYPANGEDAAFAMGSLELLGLIGELNADLGGDAWEQKGIGRRVDLMCGAVTSPFKWQPEESALQYLKLLKKVTAGAQFIITQMGYDAEKHREFADFAQSHLAGVPAIAHVFILNSNLAQAMNEGHFPGCYAGRKLYADLVEEERSADGGRDARLLRAAKQVAVIKGLGYRGVHLGGVSMDAEGVQSILDAAATLATDWRGCAADLGYAPENGWYLSDQEAAALAPTDYSADEAYQRVVAGCPKRLKDGPCGGGMAGSCEVGTGRKCVHVLAYQAALR
jgi:methylenetetrahydrofolate reductase (NADPH)